MAQFTAAHWGVYEVAPDATAAPSVRPLAGDPDPSPIGLSEHDPSLLDARVRRPAVRRSWLEGGPGTRPELRGREPFVEVSWNRALDLLAADIDRVRTIHGNAAIFGGSYGWASAGRFHHAQSQMHRFLNAAGGYVRHVTSYSLGAAHVIMPRVVAPMTELMADHTSWDVLAAHTGLFVTFGGVPAKNSQCAPGGAGRHRVRDGLRAMAANGVRFVNVGPCDDNLDPACKAEWIRCRPNTDTALMLALAWQLVEGGLEDRSFLATHCSGYNRFLPYVLGQSDGVPKTPAWAEAITGVPATRIRALAREMAAVRTMVNAAWSLQRAHHGEQPYWMVVTLAAMLGQIGLPGGGFGVGYGAINTLGSPHRRLSGPTLSQGRNPVAAFIPVARIADMLLEPRGAFRYDGAERTYPDIRLIYWAGGNPFHHHQDLNRLERAWAKPETVVVNEPFWTATAKHADIVLPVTTTAERGDIGYATQEGLLVAMKRFAAPHGEARDDYDIFADLARRLGVEAAFTEGRDSAGWLRFLYDDCRARWQARGVSIPSFDDFWRDGLIDLAPHDAPNVMLSAFRADPAAHPLTTPTGRIEIFSEPIASFELADCPPHPSWQEPAEWLGAAGDGWLHLVSDQPVRRLHSQLDPSPHSRAGKVAGREPIYMNPFDAAARGLAAGDVVEVSNARGRCLAGLVTTEALMRGVVRLATGAWFDPDGEGPEKHGNPNVLTLDRGASSLSQGCAAQTCLVRVHGPVNAAPPVTAFDAPALLPDAQPSQETPQIGERPA